MLPLDPPLAALHGARIDHSGAFAHGVLNSVEHFTASTLRLQNVVLEQYAERARKHDHFLSPMAALDAVTDPSVTKLGASLVEEHIHLAADLGTRWVAWGEWHQHGMNALVEHWLDRCERHYAGLPAMSGIAVLKSAVESADHSVSEAAVVIVNATEAAANEAERIGASVRPVRRAKAGAK